MIVVEYNNIEIDFCQSCQGIWLDQGELELLLGSAGDSDKITKMLKEKVTVHEKPRRCPICLKKMRKIELGDQRPVMIDQCRQKHGLWFDRGELKDILEQLQSQNDDAVLKFLRDIFTNST